jgi:hypothetical protein
MNERIRELFKQAGGKTSARNLASNPVQVVETHELWDDRIEKFAELLVLECVNAVMDGTKEGDHYAMRIENHFDSGNGGILYFRDKK